MNQQQQEPEWLTANDDVGISLMAGDEADAILDVLKEELGDHLKIKDCITYLKLETAVGHIEIRFAEVAEMLGRPFTLSDFLTILSSYYGRPCVDEDRMAIHSSMTAGVLDNDALD